MPKYSRKIGLGSKLAELRQERQEVFFQRAFEAAPPLGALHLRGHQDGYSTTRQSSLTTDPARPLTIKSTSMPKRIRAGQDNQHRCCTCQPQYCSPRSRKKSSKRCILASSPSSSGSAASPVDSCAVSDESSSVRPQDGCQPPAPMHQHMALCGIRHVHTGSAGTPLRPWMV